MTSGNTDSEFGGRQHSSWIGPQLFIAAEQVFLARWHLTAATVTKGLRGVPLPIIQQLMGHTNPATTTIYTRATANDTTGVLDDAGWLA